MQYSARPHRTEGECHRLKPSVHRAFRIFRDVRFRAES
jgi:hypothetical protein